jgi:nitrite reductase (NADH) small subunit
MGLNIKEYIMSWEFVCKSSEVPTDAGVAALVGNQQIAIFNITGAYFAIDNFDPVSQANILARGIVGSIKGELVVASPLYKQHYSLQTGQCLEQENIRVMCYPLRCIDDRIEINREPVAQMVA